jgi:cyanophycinase-like exopeptidase
MSGPRILAIMGSGETAPTMAKVHRGLLDRFGAEPATVAIVDTPYGFQENADDLSARTVEFFETSVGRPAVVASYRSRDVDPITLSTAVSRIREAPYVMAGPGSPSYALRQWTDGPIPAALGAKLESGGVLTMASAAALTLGVVTIPVYEIYKVGDDPHWLEGLDLFGGATGLRAAVVPHYDNAEGGNHDTRFCYMGERRLQVLEAALPADTAILGIDSHTALVLDLESGTASVSGLGAATIRGSGRSVAFPSGSDLPIATLAEVAQQLAAGEVVEIETGRGSRNGNPSAGRTGNGGRAVAPMRDEMAQLEGTFVDALGQDDTPTAVGALLDLDSSISGRVRSGEDSPDLDNATATFRALITRLGERAADGPRDARALLEPFVVTLLELRARARASRDWETADLIRDRLTAAGVEVRDAADDSTWVLQETSAR